MAENIELTNKPLVEAIFELRWKLVQEKDISYDPHYQILLGRLFDRIENEYSEHHSLPSATIPDKFASYMVQHQFRKEGTGWPLIQIGPGLVTLNDTTSYNWIDFQARIHSLLNALFEVYPSSNGGLITTNVILRYIDSVEFDFEKNDIFTFLSEELKTSINLHSGLFDKTGVEKNPLNFDLKFEYPSTSPIGAMKLRFVKGQKNKIDSLIWESHVTSAGKDAPMGKESIIKWADLAHELSHNWFFEMIEGDLLKQFQ